MFFQVYCVFHTLRGSCTREVLNPLTGYKYSVCFWRQKDRRCKVVQGTAAPPLYDCKGTTWTHSAFLASFALPARTDQPAPCDHRATRPIQIPDSRLPVRLQTPHRSRSRRRSFGSSVCSSMYVSEHPARLISDVGAPGRLSRSSVVLGPMRPVCLVRRSPRAHASNSVDGVRCGRDELIPARHGLNTAMQRRPGTAVGRKVSSPPCMTRSSTLSLSSY